MKRTAFTLLSFSAAAICVAVLLPSQPETAGGFAITAGTVIEENLPETADSVVITPDSLLNRALESFKRNTFMKLEGESDELLYPHILVSYGDVREALAAQEPRSRGWNQCREMLREIDRDLYNGAFYYSQRGNREQLNRFAQAYLDIQLMDEFKDERWNIDPVAQPMLAYIAASGAYNAKEYDKAIEYFKVYFSTGDSKQREPVYLFMGQACLNTGKYDLGINTLKNGIEFYPQNKQMALTGIQLCVDGGRAEHMQTFLTAARAIDPTDESLANVQGKLWEDQGNYKDALNLYSELDLANPNKLSNAKHIGLCYYNLGVSSFNNAIAEEDEKRAGKMRRQSKSYFNAAAAKLSEVVASDPMNVKYLKALGVSLLCLEQKEEFNKVNERIVALGADPLSEVFIPPVVSYNESGDLNFGFNSGSITSNEAPLFSEYGRDFVTERLQKWVKKGEFESMADYQQRVNDLSIKKEYDNLIAEAGNSYLAEYGNKLRLTDIKLQPYDATNETFLIESSYGPIYLHVPLQNHEAEMFKANFAAVQLRNPSYFIDDNQVKISSITFVAKNGKQYQYDNARARDYNGAPDINIDFAAILGSEKSKNTQRNNNNSRQGLRITKKSDVDENIPVAKRSNTNTVAMIIANEDYMKAVKVESAINDGNAMAEYCRKTLGMPTQNVTLTTNASLGNLFSAITDLKHKVDVLNGEADVVVYYAGHGMPDERTKDAFLMPVDADPTLPETCYALSRLYKELGELNAKSVMVFIDACFSGAERGGDMLTSARAVAIKTNAAAPKGNMFVFSAAQGNETALPYRDKNHGLFTYFLLQKLQKSKGDVTLKELSDYVTSEVKSYSTFMNKKPQTPAVVTSGRMTDMWKSKKMTK